MKNARKKEEGHGVDKQLSSASGADCFVLDIVDDVERAQDACKEHDGQTQHQVPWVKERIESCRGIGPTADDGRSNRGERRLIDDEVGAIEEGSHSTAKQQRTEDAVEDEEVAVGARAEQVASLQLKLIAHGLEHEREEDDHPKPVAPPKLVL